MQTHSSIPDDLYIPPDALEVVLESFEGPLDLLLYLIRRQNMNILDVDVSAVTEQYMAYIEVMHQMRFELAAEYLVMAAMLAEIKSRCLLPRHRDAPDDEEDPRAQLIRRLQEYERYKQAAEDLDALPRVGRDLFVVSIDYARQKREQVPPEVSLDELLDAMRAVVKRSALYDHHHIQAEKLSVRERMSHILLRLQRGQFARIEQFFNAREGRLGAVVSFMAVLELVKEGLIEVVQAEVFSEIHLRLKDGNESDGMTAADTLDPGGVLP